LDSTHSHGKNRTVAVLIAAPVRKWGALSVRQQLIDVSNASHDLSLKYCEDSDREKKLAKIDATFLLLGDGPLTRMDESSRRIQRPAAPKATQYHAADIGNGFAQPSRYSRNCVPFSFSSHKK